MMVNDDSSREREGLPAGSHDLYVRVRAAFVAQDTTLNRWCLENGVARRYANMALQGELTGDKALALKARILDAAGIVE